MTEVAGERTQPRDNLQHSGEGRDCILQRQSRSVRVLQLAREKIDSVQFSERERLELQMELQKLTPLDREKLEVDGSQVDRENLQSVVHEPQSGRSDEDSKRVKNLPQCEWSAESISCLLNSYGEKYASRRGYLRNKDWEEVLYNVNARCEGLNDVKTLRQCREKVDSLKKKYKLEKKKASGSGLTVISWPYYGKLDEMMSYQPKVTRIPGGVDAGVKLPFSEQVHVDQFFERSDQLGSPEECPADFTGHDFSCQDPFQRRKIGVEGIDGLSEEGFNIPSYRQKQLLDKVCIQESLDKGSRSRKGPQQPKILGKVLYKKRRAKAANPMQALADAVAGFSDVFARIEMAKMEIFTKMKVEMAKLERKSRKKRNQSSTSSSETE